MSNEFILKKNIFGGFDRRQVIDCIAHLQSQCTHSNTQNEIERTKQQINQLLEKIEDRNKTINALNNELDSLKSMEDTPISDVLKTIEKADRIVNSAKQEAEQYINRANETSNQSKEKFKNLMLRVSALNSELVSMGKDAGNISLKLESLKTEECDIKNENKIAVETAEPSEETSYHDNETEDIFEEEYEEISLPETFDNDTAEENFLFNSIDNFFAELEKLTDIERINED